MKIPDYKVYQVKDAPALVELEEMLAAKGLKDPWIRNEVWRFNGQFGQPRQMKLNFFFRGFKYGFAAFVATVAIETALAKTGASHGGHH